MSAVVSPAGVLFTPDELLILWAELCRRPTVENQPMRDTIKAWLESRELNHGNQIPSG